MTGSKSPRDDLAVQMLALGAQIQGLRDQLANLAGLGEQVTGLADDVDALRDRVADLGGVDQGDAVTEVRMWDWTRMSREEAAVAWPVLLDWVSEVLVGVFDSVGQYSGRNVHLPICWYRHPDAVAELGWLCQEWIKIYRSGKGTSSAAGEWHDRWLPGVLRRLTRDSQMSACVREGKHVDPRPGQAVDDPDVARAAVQADIDRRRPEAAGLE
ncbi:MAG: hypothetical protein JXA67_07310 [Micromonosporaceae bacterium]|nr:hypothetical protein [Micromonosporaceae bacterium]